MRLVLSQGVFDLLHVSHVRHLQQAKNYGDKLVVGVTMDGHVNKGPDRPIIPLKQRLEMVRALVWVDDALPCIDCIDALEMWKPDVLCKDSRYKDIGLLPEELKYCADHGIKIVYTDPNPQTTTALVEKIRCAS